MFLHNSRNLILIGACVAVSGIAAAVVLHHRRVDNTGPGQPAVYSTGYAQSAYPAAPGPPPPAYSQPSAYSGSGDYQDGYYSTIPRPVFVRPPEYSAAPPPVEVSPQPVYREREIYGSRHYRHRGRSKAHSAEIVAGTAAVGAAIGGIAGGGKGAAIGAITGGAGGFAYDRLTHNH